MCGDFRFAGTTSPRSDHAQAFRSYIICTLSSSWCNCRRFRHPAGFPASLPNARSSNPLGWSILWMRGSQTHSPCSPQNLSLAVDAPTAHSVHSTVRRVTKRSGEFTLCRVCLAARRVPKLLGIWRALGSVFPVRCAPGFGTFRSATHSETHRTAR